ncbi:histone deacetylase complex subunit SAP18-like [Clavelina lepadiformis]|uniref:18 kDa Sin3-associated polypeptide n=1 Tax=Clavelina lepadiformis TaxID=159417 RepID=A0ABP0EY21_CLALP
MPQSGAIEERLRSVAQDAPAQEPAKPVDREKTCPLLLRVFVSDDGRHHRPDDFSKTSVPSNELQIYTWMDASLKELTSLVKEVRPDARKKGTVFKFAVVFQDRTGRFRMREVGQTVGGSKGPNDTVTLASHHFEIGDFMDIAIQLPRDSRRY